MLKFEEEIDLKEKHKENGDKMLKVAKYLLELAKQKLEVKIN